MAPERCVLCSRMASAQSLPDGMGFRFECERCGKFEVTSQFRQDRPSKGEREVFLSCATRQAREKGGLLRLTNENWQEIADRHSRTSVPEKAEKLLQYIALKVPNPGDQHRIHTDMDYPVLDGRSSSEVDFFLDYLAKCNLIELVGDVAKVTVAGWERLQPLGIGHGEPGRCFVAMSFHECLDSLYFKAIKPSIEDDCKFRAIRMKQELHNDDINYHILAEIRRCHFMVADFTMQNRGVYFEAGFARALGKEVVFTCREKEIKRLHFDTNHFLHETWNTPEELRTKLATRIRATIPAPKA